MAALASLPSLLISIKGMVLRKLDFEMATLLTVITQAKVLIVA